MAGTVILDGQFRSFYQTEPSHSEFLKTVTDIAAAIKASYNVLNVGGLRQMILDELDEIPGGVEYMESLTSNIVHSSGYGMGLRSTEVQAEVIQMIRDGILVRSGDGMIRVKSIPPLPGRRSGEVKSSLDDLLYFIAEYDEEGVPEYDIKRDYGSAVALDLNVLRSRGLIRELSNGNWAATQRGYDQAGKSVSLPVLFAKSCLAYCIAALSNNTKAMQAVQTVINQIGRISGQLLDLEKQTNDIDIPSLDERNDPKFRRAQMLLLQAANQLESAIRQFEMLPEA